jgi:ubiquinone/menaquinone biosynthesis C-methylase UbiE
VSGRFLTRSELRAFYDRFGAKQDWQRFYEGPAMRHLVRKGEFEAAASVFEFGCGTGAFAEDLLANHLPKTASYLGMDISSTMVALARRRLARFKDRAEVRLTDGSVRFDQPDGSFDRFVSNYVLDLLSPDDIREVLDEAYRLLLPGGRLCLMSLTHGQSLPSRILIWAWSRVHRLRPSLVGGCRPVELREFVPRDRWRVDDDRVVSAFGIPSEILVATKVVKKELNAVNLSPIQR